MKKKYLLTLLDIKRESKCYPGFSRILPLFKLKQRGVHICGGADKPSTYIGKNCTLSWRSGRRYFSHFQYNDFNHKWWNQVYRCCFERAILLPLHRRCPVIEFCSGASRKDASKGGHTISRTFTCMKFSTSNLRRLRYRGREAPPRKWLLQIEYISEIERWKPGGFLLSLTL